MTGEFGGFSAYAMIMNMRLFGPKTGLMAAVDRYLKNWALNAGHADNPLPCTVCKKPSTYLNRNYSAYHLSQTINYMQQEVFLLQELVDYHLLTDDASMLNEAIALGRHMVKDHVMPNGMVECHDDDYTTVDLPGIALLRLGNVLAQQKRPEANEFLAVAERIVEHLIARGLQFPTEGEACTEDGSFACTTLTLLYAYLHLKNDPRYRERGLQLLALHEKLMMHGMDCRMRGSSIRFWETIYETDAWGPSINCGHGWTIWTAAAKVCAYLVTGQSRYLKEAYESFLSALCNIDANGGIFSCYTPDMIPGTPHPAAPGYGATKTSVHLGMRQPPSYSASGNHTLVRAADAWAFMSGFIPEDRIAINGHLDGDCFVSAAPRFNRLALSNLPPEGFRTRTPIGEHLTITFDTELRNVQLFGGQIEQQDEHSITCLVKEPVICIRSGGR